MTWLTLNSSRKGAGQHGPIVVNMKLVRYLGEAGETPNYVAGTVLVFSDEHYLYVRETVGQILTAIPPDVTPA